MAPNGAGWGACAPQERIGGANSELATHDLRINGRRLIVVVPWEHSIQSLFELCHHAIHKVLVAGSLGVSVGVHKLSKGAFVHW